MAIINSLGIGRGKKSAGNLTYRTVRGRCIASQKQEKRGPVKGAYSIAQATFSLVSTFMRAHAADIDVSFDKTAYGSARNNFYKTNKSALAAALATLANEYAYAKNKADITAIDAAIASYAQTNPKAIVRVKLSGFDTVYLTGAWSSVDNPVVGGGINELGRGTATVFSGTITNVGQVATSLKFYPGAKIVRAAGSATITCPGLPAGVTADQVKYLDGSGAPISALSVTNVSKSEAGKIVFGAPSVSEDQNALALQVGNVYVRLTSAYVTKGDEGTNP